MRKTPRWMASLLLLGSAACAHDGVLAPQLTPEPAGAELAVAATAAAPAENPATRPRQFVIRCSSSISASQEPLYVVDGVIGAQAADIRAEDIEGIQVMRGARAAALYGARAENGVVIVTTRAGKARAAS
jgi:TonB-dependent SusC/RagA subfamily outer membrane receptor